MGKEDTVFKNIYQNWLRTARVCGTLSTNFHDRSFALYPDICGTEETGLPLPLLSHKAFGGERLLEGSIVSLDGKVYYTHYR